MTCCGHPNRREFFEIAAATSALAGAASLPRTAAAQHVADWDPDKPYTRTGKVLMVLPVLVCEIPTPTPETSWRVWGGFPAESDAVDELRIIAGELEVLQQQANFPLKVLPPVWVRDEAEAATVRHTLCDVVVLYSAQTKRLVESCMVDGRDHLIFVRHRSGRLYTFYEIAHSRLLRTGDQVHNLDELRFPRIMDTRDVVVDEPTELLWRLRALFAKKNLLGRRILSVGPAGGWSNPQAPDLAREKYGLDIIEISYDTLGARIEQAMTDSALMQRVRQWTDRCFKMPLTYRETKEEFLSRAFLIYVIFKDLMRENDAEVFTIGQCMSVVLKISKTTACMPLTWLNDEGLVAFCESDFNVIPSGILLHYAAGTPVFLHNPCFPHDGIITCAHCTAPRRMDGQHYLQVKITTHFESDFGAAPQVYFPSGQNVTIINPYAKQTRWIGFKGTIRESTDLPICRSQYDVEIHGSWEKLRDEMRGFHWMMAFGDHLKEAGYAAGKLGVDWMEIA